MNAANEMLNGALALERALALASDWRVRGALADAATIVRASRFIQQKIDSGQLKIETEPPPSRSSTSVTAKVRLP